MIEFCNWQHYINLKTLSKSSISICQCFQSRDIKTVYTFWLKSKIASWSWGLIYQPKFKTMCLLFLKRNMHVKSLKDHKSINEINKQWKLMFMLTYFWCTKKASLLMLSLAAHLEVPKCWASFSPIRESTHWKGKASLYVINR